MLALRAVPIGQTIPHDGRRLKAGKRPYPRYIRRIPLYAVGDETVPQRDAGPERSASTARNNNLCAKPN